MLRSSPSATLRGGSFLFFPYLLKRLNIPCLTATVTYRHHTLAAEEVMTFLALLEEIWAVTPKECDEIDLDDDMTGDIAALVDNFHTRQLATLYRVKQKEFMRICAQMEPHKEEDLPAQLVAESNTISSQITVLWEMLAFDLETQFGHLLTLSERDENYSWNLRAGWILWKSPPEDTTPRSRKVTSAKKRAMMI